jgi:hypothetical protein
MEIGLDVVALNNHIVGIKVKMCKNTIEDILLDGGFRINIITKQLYSKLGCQNPNLHLTT